MLRRKLIFKLEIYLISIFSQTKPNFLNYQSTRDINSIIFKALTTPQKLTQDSFDTEENLETTYFTESISISPTSEMTSTSNYSLNSFITEQNKGKLLSFYQRILAQLLITSY